MFARVIAGQEGAIYMNFDSQKKKKKAENPCVHVGVEVKARKAFLKL